MKNIYKLLSISLLSCAVVGCKSAKKDDDKILPAEELYQEGNSLMSEKKYKQAADSFSKLYFQYPGTEYGTKAELLEAQALYEGNEYDDAVDVLKHFIELHPTSKEAEYAYYLKAMSYYMQINKVSLDQSAAKSAKVALEDVIKRYKGGKYAKDAELKLDLVNEHLAGKEMYVGRFYSKRENPIAAINRYQSVTEHYPTTSLVPEALYRLVESYYALGLVDEAKKYASILGNNFNNSEWYKKAYKVMEG